MAIDKDKVAQRIKELVRSKGLTQAQLAEKTGISQAAISQIVNAERYPTTPTLMQIARALTVSMDSLVGKDEARDTTSAVAEAISNDEVLLQFFRNFQSLDPHTQEILREQVQLMKDRKK